MVPLRTPVDFGLIIRERRRKLRLGQAELAQRVGVSRQWIVEVEKGKPRAEIGLILRTIRVLGIDLLADTGERSDASRPDAVQAVDIDEILNDLASDRK